jgi:hypothetical protein
VLCASEEGAWLAQPINCFLTRDDLDAETQALELFRRNLTRLEYESARLQQTLVDGRIMYDAYKLDLATRLSRDPLAEARKAHVDALVAIGEAYISRNGWTHRGTNSAVACERAEAHAFRALSQLGAEYTVLWAIPKAQPPPRTDDVAHWLPLLEAAAVYLHASPLVLYVTRALRILSGQAHRMPPSLADMHAFIDRCQAERTCHFAFNERKYAARLVTAAGIKRKRPRPITRAERDSDFVAAFAHSGRRQLF